MATSFTGIEPGFFRSLACYANRSRFKTFVICLLALANVPLAAGEELLTASSASWPITAVTLASANANNAQGNGNSDRPVISANGRFVAFSSIATNLSAGHTSGQQVFLKDLLGRSVKILSANASGKMGNGKSNSPSISSNGNVVAFESSATNLVPNDTNLVQDIFVKYSTGLITRASTATEGTQANGSSSSPMISGNGRFVAFVSAASNLVSGGTSKQQVFVKDLKTLSIKLVSATAGGVQGNAASSEPSISADGRFIAFQSVATNLVPNDVNGVADVFVKDMLTDEIELASSSLGDQANMPSQSPALSPDGRHISFVTAASNLAKNCASASKQVFVKNLISGSTRCASTTVKGVAGNAASASPSLSSSGRYVAFQSAASNLLPTDTNGRADIFIKDLTTGAIRISRANVSAAAAQANNNSYSPIISLDGRFVAFSSLGTNLIDGDRNRASDIFVAPSPIYQKTVSKITRISERPAPTKTTQGRADQPRAVVQGAGDSGLFGMAISFSGRFIAFSSLATNLVSGPCPGIAIYVKDLSTGEIRCVSTGSHDQKLPSISADGRYVAFHAGPFATNGTPCTREDVHSIFVVDWKAGEPRCASTTAGGTRANNLSIYPSISADGRYVAFSSASTNLVLGDHNNEFDIFVKDLRTGVVTLVSSNADGQPDSGWLPTLSANGQYVAFRSARGTSIKDLGTGEITDVAPFSTCKALSPEGLFLVFEERIAGYIQIQRKNLRTGEVVTASANVNGILGNDESGLGIFIDDGCNSQPISGDGRYLVFRSAADNLVPNDTNGSDDIFVKDLVTGAIARLSVDANGVEGNDHSFNPTISFDGLTVAFGSYADNLVSSDTGLCGAYNCPDVFMVPNPLPLR